jgi:hypothetical protein
MLPSDLLQGVEHHGLAAIRLALPLLLENRFPNRQCSSLRVRCVPQVQAILRSNVDPRRITSLRAKKTAC